MKNIPRSILIVTSVVFLLAILIGINYNAEIDPETCYNLELNRSKSAQEIEKRQFLTLIMFQQTGIVVTLSLLPIGISMFHNRDAYSKHKTRFFIAYKKGENDESNTLSDRLLANYPNLTLHDITLCEMLCKKLSSKQIAFQLNIFPTSVNTARYRLRKKMGVPSEIELTAFLRRV